MGTRKEILEKKFNFKYFSENNRCVKLPFVDLHTKYLQQLKSHWHWRKKVRTQCRLPLWVQLPRHLIHHHCFPEGALGGSRQEWNWALYSDRIMWCGHPKWPVNQWAKCLPWEITLWHWFIDIYRYAFSKGKNRNHKTFIKY